jgi:UDP-N-acetylglucosamine 1-carboxyvinyltransferase
VGQLVVEGGRKLVGTVRIGGAKNAALPVLAACVLADGPLTLDNVPLGLRDVRLMIRILNTIGIRTQVLGPSTLRVDASGPIASEVPDDLMSQMRASLFLAGPLLARTGRAVVSRPGGCDIGDRPIDLHLKGLHTLGARFDDTPSGRIATTAQRLRGANVYLDFPSVGATENIMMAAVAAEGETVVENAAREPEIVDLAQFLRRMGADIAGAGTDTIRIVGGRPLAPANHQIIPDRIEAGTFAIAAAVTRGDVELVGTLPDHLTPLWRKFDDMGVGVDFVPGSDRVRIFVSEDAGLRPCSIRTGPHPGFPTDLQPQMAVLMTQAGGASTIVETVFENRLRYMGDLRRMGARILTDGHMAVVHGPSPMAGTAVTATDLRAGAALVLAGLVAEGETRVEGLEVIERGYERLSERLAALGAMAVPSVEDPVA